MSFLISKHNNKMENKGSKDEIDWEEFQRKKIMREAINKLNEIDDEKKRKKLSENHSKN